MVSEPRSHENGIDHRDRGGLRSERRIPPARTAPEAKGRIRLPERVRPHHVLVPMAQDVVAEERVVPRPRAHRAAERCVTDAGADGQRTGDGEAGGQARGRARTFLGRMSNRASSSLGQPGRRSQHRCTEDTRVRGGEARATGQAFVPPPSPRSRGRARPRNRQALDPGSAARSPARTGRAGHPACTARPSRCQAAGSSHTGAGFPIQIQPTKSVNGGSPPSSRSRVLIWPRW